MSIADKVVNDKYYGKVNTEKSIGGSLHNRFFFVFCFCCFSFFLLIVNRMSHCLVRFLSKLIPVNISQYRGVVGVFNSRFIHIKQPNIFKNAFCQSKVKQTIAKETLSVFGSFSIFLLISISWSFVDLQVVRRFCFCVLLNFVDHIWLYLIISNRSGDIEKILDQSLILVNVFLYLTGI